MWLASVDGAVTPVEEALIPVSDEGLLRGDGGFEVLRVYGGRPFALDDHLARLGADVRGPAAARPTSTRCTPRRSRDRRAGEPESLLRLVVTRGGRRIAIAEPLPAPAAVARVATVTYAPTRVLNGLKTLSYAGNMLAGRIAQGAGRRRGAARHPARPRAGGPDVDVLLGRAAAGCTRRRCPTASSTRSRARRLLEECDVTEAPCTLDDVRAAEEAFIASSVREVMPIAAVDDIVLPHAPGPVTEAAHAAFRRRVARELASGARLSASRPAPPSASRGTRAGAATRRGRAATGRA